MPLLVYFHRTGSNVTIKAPVVLREAVPEDGAMVVREVIS